MPAEGVAGLPDDERRRLEIEIGDLAGRTARYDDLFLALDAVTDAALRNVSLDDLLDDVLGRLISVLHADSATVLLLDPGRDMLVRRASAGLEAGHLGDVEVPIGKGISGGVAERGQAVLIEDTREHDVVNPTIHRYLRSLVAVPLLHESHVIGTLHVGTAAPQAFSDTDLRFTTIVAARLAMSITNAKLHDAAAESYAAEHAARMAAETAAARTRRLLAVAEAFGRALSKEEASEILLEHAAEATGAIAGAVFTRDGGDLVVTAVRGDPAATAPAGRRLPIEADRPPCEAVRTGTAVWIGSRGESNVRYPDRAGESGDRPYDGAAALPLTVAGETIGALGLEFPKGASAAIEEASVVAIARQFAVAYERIRLRDAERESSWRARTLVDANVVGTIVGDARGRIVDANQAALDMLGFTREDLAKGLLDWRALTPPEHLETSENALREARLTGRATPYEKEYYRKDGSRIPVLVGLAVLREEPFEAIVFIVDLTSRQHAERQRLLLLEQERTARAEAEKANDQLAFLSEASAELVLSLDYEATLARLAELAVPRLADWCAVDLITEDRTVQRLAVQHIDPSKVDLAWDLTRRYPVDLDDPSSQGFANVVRTGRSELTSEIPRDLIEDGVRDLPEARELLLSLELRSSLIVPLSIGGSVIGAITFAMAESGRHYTRSDQMVAEDLAARAAIAIENARLYERERQSRESAEAARNKLRLLADLDEALSSSLEPVAAADTFVRFLADRIGDYAIVYVMGRDRRIAYIAGAHRHPGDEEGLRKLLASGTPDLDDPDSLIAAIVAGGGGQLWAAMSLDTLDRIATADQRPAWRELGCESAMLFPIRLHGATLGAVAICRSDPRAAFGDEDFAFLQDVAERTAQVFENARLYEERRFIADTLQRSLIPPALPEIPGARIALAYRPAGDGTQVGGDFYDVFPTGPEEWALVIGDVCGKGAGAAAVMALSRYTIRTAALSESRPSAILQTLNNALLAQTGEDRYCTACQIRLRPDAHGARLTVSSGGHPLPIVVRSDGSLDTVGVPGTLLGYFPDPVLRDDAVDLNSGDTIVMYTDGITDERRDGEEFGERRLSLVLRDCAGLPADELVDRLMAAVLGFRDGDPTDDIAILAVELLR